MPRVFYHDYDSNYDTDTIKYDSIVTSVIEKFKLRSLMGKQKYGTDLDRKDLLIVQWIVHAQEEHMDAILYLEKLKTEMMLNVHGTNGSSK